MRRSKRRAARVSAGTDEAAALELIADDGPRVSKRGWGWWHLTVAGVAEIDRLEGAIAAEGVVNRG